jgi:hypothetical protein
MCVLAVVVTDKCALDAVGSTAVRWLTAAVTPVALRHALPTVIVALCMLEFVSRSCGES